MYGAALRHGGGGQVHLRAALSAHVRAHQDAVRDGEADGAQAALRVAAQQPGDGDLRGGQHASNGVRHLHPQAGPRQPRPRQRRPGRNREGRPHLDPL
eukprot:7527905-Pyramimonas_sp.AAC.1